MRFDEWPTQPNDWAREVERAAERWEGGETQISLDRWRAACLAKAAQPGGIGSPEWRRRCRRAAWRGRIRHPFRTWRQYTLEWLLRILRDDA